MSADEWNSDEMKFVALTNYNFEWDDCVMLLGPNGEEVFIDRSPEGDEPPIDEAIYMIEDQGYTPIPF